MHLKAAWDAGFVDADTGSIAAGFPEGVAAKAQKEQVERLRVVAEAQSSAKSDAATSQARGAPASTSADPAESSKEKDGKKKRGEGNK
jgi:hypothetical protein